jgi:hypothetical protein
MRIHVNHALTNLDTASLMRMIDYPALNVIFLRFDAS